MEKSWLQFIRSHNLRQCIRETMSFFRYFSHSRFAYSHIYIIIFDIFHWLVLLIFFLLTFANVKEEKKLIWYIFKMTTIKKICWKKGKRVSKQENEAEKKQVVEMLHGNFFLQVSLLFAAFFMMIGDETRNNIVFSVI